MAAAVVNSVILGCLGLVLMGWGVSSFRTTLRLHKVGERVTGKIVDAKDGTFDIDSGQHYTSVVTFTTLAGREYTVELKDYDAWGRTAEILYDPADPSVVEAGSIGEHRLSLVLEPLGAAAGLALICYAAIRLT